MPKAGSSYLQKYFFSKLNNNSQPNVHGESVDSYKKILSSILNKKKGNNLIFSNEGIIGMMNPPINKPGYAFFKNFLTHCKKSSHSIKFIIILRPLDDCIFSIYLDQFKKGKINCSYLDFLKNKKKSEFSISKRIKLLNSFQTCFVSQDELLKKPNKTFLKILKFIQKKKKINFFSKIKNKKLNITPKSIVSLYIHRYFCRVSYYYELIEKQVNFFTNKYFSIELLPKVYLATKNRRDKLVIFLDYFFSDYNFFKIKKKKVSYDWIKFFEQENKLIFKLLKK